MLSTEEEEEEEAFGWMLLFRVDGFKLMEKE
jgi:hypothetical protein